MDLATIQAIAAIVSQIGFPATLGVLAVIMTWNLMPVVADYLRSKIRTEHATAQQIERRTDDIH